MNQRRLPQLADNAACLRLQARYDQMWSATIGKIRSGAVVPDPVLLAGLPDRRRGLTVIARPPAGVRRRVAAFIDQLRQIEPHQYYYASSELHLTVLSLFTATVKHRSFFQRTKQYLAAVASALARTVPFQVDFVGVTVSPEAVMIQGFVDNDALSHSRDCLRSELRARGLAAAVDTRYRLITAHMTIGRFRAPLRDGAHFADKLERARHLRFGMTRIAKVSMVKNDWYMSRQVLETLRHYRLRAPGRQP